jgi:hypothetical protein
MLPRRASFEAACAAPCERSNSLARAMRGALLERNASSPRACVSAHAEHSHTTKTTQPKARNSCISGGLRRSVTQAFV